MRKVLIALFACFAFIQVASAQVYYESDTDIYGLGKSTGPKWTKTVSLGIVPQLDFGVGVRRNFKKGFSWDVLTLSYGRKYTNNEIDGDFKVNFKVKNDFKFMTALRYTSPNIGKVKVYGSIGGGGEVVSGTERDYSDDTDTAVYIPVNFQLGVYVTKKLNVGLQITRSISMDGDYPDFTTPMLRVGYDF